VGYGHTKGQKVPAAANQLGYEVFKRMMEPFSYNVHQVRYDTQFSFHFDYIMGFCAPGIATSPKGAFLDGIPGPLKDWYFVWIERDETAIHGAGNLMPLGPGSSGQHRVLVPAKTKRENGIRVIRNKTNTVTFELITWQVPVTGDLHLSLYGQSSGEVLDNIFLSMWEVGAVRGIEFQHRDALLEIFENDPKAIWMSMPHSAPTASQKSPQLFRAPAIHASCRTSW
jgi:hypothetical protein